MKTQIAKAISDIHCCKSGEILCGEGGLLTIRSTRRSLDGHNKVTGYLVRIDDQHDSFTVSPSEVAVIEIESRRVGRFVSISGDAPKGWCFCSGQHSVEAESPHGVLADMLPLLMEDLAAMDIRECECEDCMETHE